MGLTIVVVKTKEPCPLCCGMDCGCNKEGSQQMECYACSKMATDCIKIAEMPVCPECQPLIKYSILDALKEIPTNKKSLMIVRLSDGEVYNVRSHDPVTKITVLKGTHGKTMRVRLVNKEFLKYKPVWR